MTHVGQEGALGLRGQFGALLCLEQIDFHAPALAQVGHQYDHLGRAAQAVDDRVAVDLHIDTVALAVGEAVLTDHKLTSANAGPGFIAKLSVVDQLLEAAPLELVFGAAAQRQKVRVGKLDLAMHIQVKHALGLADGPHDALELRRAQLGLGNINDDSVDPFGVALLVENGAGVLGYPANLAVAVEDAVLEVVLFMAAEGAHDVLDGEVAVGRVNDVGKTQVAGEKALGRPAGQLLYGITDKQHSPVFARQAAKGNAWNVADQAAVLLLALAHRGFEFPPFGNVAEEADEQVFAREPGLSHGDPGRE